MIKSRLVYEYEIDHLLLEANYRELRRTEENAASIQALLAAPRNSMPDIDRLIKSRLINGLLFKVQELIWTTRSLRRRLGSQAHPTIQSEDHNSVGEIELEVRDPNNGKGIFLDITATKTGRVFGGIKCVANALTDACLSTGLATPIIKDSGAIREFGSTGSGKKVELRKGDIFVIIDHFWDAFNCYGEDLTSFRREGIIIATCIHDLIPLEYPALISPDLTKKQSDMLPKAVNGSDIIFSVSQSSASAIKNYILKNGICSNGDIEVRWFYNGTSPAAPSGSSNVREGFRSKFNRDHVFISVGSMMPHKAHRVAIKAFESLWASGSQFLYIIIGAKMEDSAIEHYVRNHDRFGVDLLRIDDANDSEVQWAYQNAYCLIHPSIAEGFGLPIIEARKSNLRVIASDIPVFREICGNGFCYFDACDAQMLSQKISTFEPRGNATQPEVEVLDWTGSLKMLCDTVARKS